MLEKFNKTTRIIIGATLAVVIWIVGILIGQEQTVLILNPEGELTSFINRARTIQVSAMLDNGNGMIKVYPEVKLNYGDSVLKALNRVNELENKQLKLSYQMDDETKAVTQLIINGYESNPLGRQWLVWVNNILQTEDVGKIRLKAGDIVELKYVKLVQ